MKDYFSNTIKSYSTGKDHYNQLIRLFDYYHPSQMAKVLKAIYLEIRRSYPTSQSLIEQLFHLKQHFKYFQLCHKGMFQEVRSQLTFVTDEPPSLSTAGEVVDGVFYSLFTAYSPQELFRTLLDSLALLHRRSFFQQRTLSAQIILDVARATYAEAEYYGSFTDYYQYSNFKISLQEAVSNC